jgi:hypothetical protein
MSSGSDYGFSMPQTAREVAARIAAWSALALGVYAIAAAASLLGPTTGAVAGLMGLLLSGAVLVEHTIGRLRRVARIAFVLHALPVLVLALILAVTGEWPWEI